MQSKRMRFMVGHAERASVEAAARSSGRTISDLLRIIIRKSTNNLDNFSIVSQANFSEMFREPRYSPLEFNVPPDFSSRISDAALVHNRSVSSFLYVLVGSATSGFSDYSVVDEINNSTVNNKEKGANK